MVTTEMTTENFEELVMSPLCVALCILCLLIPVMARIHSYTISVRDRFVPVKILTFHALNISIQHDIFIRVASRRGTSDSVVVGEIGRSLRLPDECIIAQSDNVLEITWVNVAKLTITFIRKSCADYYEVDWSTSGNQLSYFEDSFYMPGNHWYGLGHVINQPWPMEKWDSQMSPVITGESQVFEWGDYYGGVQERLWLNSQGLALFVDFDTPLFVSVNHNCDKKLTLQASHSLPYLNSNRRNLTMKYTMCIADNAKEAYLSVAGELFPTPKDIPDEQMFRFPIWSTWAQYKKAIDQRKVLSFAHNIRRHGFKDAQLEIDDDWTPAYGDWHFDSNKFPDPLNMVTKLKAMDFRVTIWVHPFANEGSNAIKEGWKDDKEYWVGSVLSGDHSDVSWWNGKGAVLDITNQEAASWLARKFERIRSEYGFDSFKIDAGEANRLSQLRRSKESLDNPNEYTRRFVQWCHQLDTELRAQEVRVGAGNQDIPMFFRLQDKDSNWSSLNGLKTLIPHVLTQGLLGYPFVLPDMIGGNAHRYVGFSETSTYPERELFIRWMEASALMPAMQFSVVPWMYDDEVVEIARSMCDLHEKYSDGIINLARESVQTGAPICRPVWWVAPLDETALTISTQFLLGDDILVAPVLEQGASSRDVYLPSGRWRCQLSGEVFVGGRWILEHAAPLYQLPHFTRVEE